MKKTLWVWLAVLAAVMLLLPWLVVLLVRGDAGMAVCFLLFFAVNPLCAIFCGAVAGRSPKKLWVLPVSAAVLFVLGTWLVFEAGERAFLLYGVVYLLLGLAAMAVSWLLRRK